MTRLVTRTCDYSCELCDDRVGVHQIKNEMHMVREPEVGRDPQCMLNRGGVGEGEGGSGSFRGEQHTRARRAAEPLATAFKERRLPRRAGVQGSEPGSGPAHRSSRTTHQGTQGPCKGAGCSLVRTHIRLLRRITAACLPHCHLSHHTRNPARHPACRVLHTPRYH